MGYIIEIFGLTKTYGNKDAVRDINITVRIFNKSDVK